jgi:arylsulfatase A-like enzyme
MAKKLTIPQGSLQSQFGTVMDIYPTLLALTVIKNPVAHIVDGFDFSAQLEGRQNTSHPDTFLMHFPHGHRSSYYTEYRSGDWKLIYRYDPSGAGKEKHELLDLKSDPSENENIVSKQPEKLQQMIKSMTNQLES